jgi:hypothetical protein
VDQCRVVPDQGIAPIARARHAREMAMVDPNLCVQCHKHPRLASLSRCAACVRAAAEEDRQARQTAESRVATKKRAREAAEARAAVEHQAALEKLGQLYIEFAASPEGVRFLEAQQAELTAPRNDPAYLQTLEDHEKDRTLVANQAAAIHHTVDSGRSWLSIGLTNPRDHAAASEAARVLGRHLEAPVIRHEDPKEATRLADRTQVQPAKHTFGREKRSLGNGNATARSKKR